MKSNHCKKIVKYEYEKTVFERATCRFDCSLKCFNIHITPNKYFFSDQNLIKISFTIMLCYENLKNVCLFVAITSALFNCIDLQLSVIKGI